MTSHTDTLQAIGPMYQLFIGADASGVIDPGYEARVVKACADRFASFTLLRGQGVFRGVAEECLVVYLASTDRGGVLALAAALRQGLGQLGIGLLGPDPETGVSTFYRVTVEGVVQ